MKIRNNGVIMHTPLIMLDSGETDVDEKTWSELEKIPSVKKELETKRLEKVKGEPVAEKAKSEPVATKENEDKPKGKK